MKKVLMTAALFSICALAADVTGTWAGNAEAARGDGSTRTEAVVFRLKQDGAAVIGSAGGESDSFVIQNGKVEGDAVTFDIVAAEDRRLFKFELKVEGDTLAGKASSNRAGGTEQVYTAKLSLKREK
jgi:hypothetical protein